MRDLIVELKHLRLHGMAAGWAELLEQVNVCVFHTKLDSDFAASWTGISPEAGHGFHGKLDSDFTRSWTVSS